jgi:hypothetical protein
MRILISFFPHSLSNNLENVRPMFAVCLRVMCYERGDNASRSIEQQRVSTVTGSTLRGVDIALVVI